MWITPWIQINVLILKECLKLFFYFLLSRKYLSNLPIKYQVTEESESKSILFFFYSRIINELPRRIVYSQISARDSTTAISKITLWILLSLECKLVDYIQTAWAIDFQIGILVCIDRIIQYIKTFFIMERSEIFICIMREIYRGNKQCCTTKRIFL